MKKILTALAIMAFGLGTINAQEETANPNAPVITFESKVVDYGTIERNSEGTRVFRFTNTGKEPLIISQMKGSCGCTTPDRSILNKPIAPGETGEIKVKYDTNRVGPFQKTVTVTSNASQSRVVLTIKGKVEQKQTAPVNESTESSRVEE